MFEERRPFQTVAVAAGQSVFPCLWSHLVKAQGFLLVVLVSVVRDPVVIKLTTLQRQLKQTLLTNRQWL